MCSGGGLGGVALKKKCKFQIYMTHVYKYTYILLICFLNTGRTISEGPDGVSHFASLQLLKMFIFFFFLFVIFVLVFFLPREGWRVHGRGCSVSQPYLF